jgi:hypothetical protein
VKNGVGDGLRRKTAQRAGAYLGGSAIFLLYKAQSPARKSRIPRIKEEQTYEKKALP